MRKMPLNYLLTLMSSATLWIVLGIFIGNSIGDSITLATISVESFLNIFRMLLGIIAVLSLVLIFYWFYYGNKASTAGELDRAKKKYIVLFITEIVFAVIMLIVFIILLINEGVESYNYALIFVLGSVLTFILFWVSTLYLSPKNVKFLPFLAKKIF